MICLGSDVGVSAPGCIEKAIELTIETGDICWHDRILVGRPSKVVTETSSSGEVDSIVMCYDFGRYISRSSDYCHIRLQKIVSKDVIKLAFRTRQLTQDAGNDGRKVGVFLPSLVKQ